MRDSNTRQFRLRTLVSPFYIPAFLGATGAGIILPILPLYIRELGAGLSQTGIILSAFAFGAVLGNLPGGAFIARFGKRNAMLASVLLEVLLAGSIVFIHDPLVLAPILFFLGASHTVFFIARLAFFREVVPAHRRGRALSLLGGVARMGTSIGPVIGGFVADAFGFRATFTLFAAFSALVFVMAATFVPRDAERERTPSRTHVQSWKPGSLRHSFDLLREYRRVFLTAGFGILTLSLVREARKVLFPLWGDLIGMSPSGIGLLFGAAYLVELALFYPAGWIMDHVGRKSTAVPCLLLFSLGFLLLPLARTPALFVAVAVLVAIGNGLGSGINMTLSSDFAPHGRVVEFLALWRTLTDVGGAASPMIVGFVSAGLGLVAAAPVIAIASLSGAAVMVLAVTETLGHESRAIEKSL